MQACTITTEGLVGIPILSGLKILIFQMLVDNLVYLYVNDDIR